MTAPRAVRIGISACLLGEKVRYDGGHKRDAFLADSFGRFVEWVPVCPEVEAGFGAPREPMHLVRSHGRVRLLTVTTAMDLTERLERFSHSRVDELASARLCGYVLKKNSPSCGLERVKVYPRHGAPEKTGRGLFAARLVDRFPQLPVEEEGRLSDPRLRENFVERVFAYAGVRDLFDAAWTIGDAVRFHTAHKLILMAHAPAAYQALGRLVARAKSMGRRTFEARYTAGLMQALAVPATRRRHVNTLAGYFKDRLDKASRSELHAAIDDYARELVPLVVPITLVRHHVRVHGVDYLAGQRYLDPHPKELMLRNHV